MDFMADQLSSGRRFRLFNVIDDYSRECHVSLVDFSIGGRRVADTLEFREGHLDGIEIGAVSRQEQEPATALL